MVDPSSVAHSAVSLTDLFATVGEGLDVDPSAQGGPDSYSLLPLLRGGTADRLAIIHHSAGGMFAIREDQWKLVLGNGSGGRSTPRGEPFQRPYRLFDLREDRDETQNLVEEHSGVAEQLERQFKRLHQQENQH